METLAQSTSVLSDKLAELEPSQAILGIVLLAVVGAFLGFMLRMNSLTKSERETVIADNRKFITDLSERHDTAMDKRDANLKEMADACHTVQRESIAVIRENTRALAMYEARRQHESDKGE